MAKISPPGDIFFEVFSEDLLRDVFYQKFYHLMALGGYPVPSRVSGVVTNGCEVLPVLKTEDLPPNCD
jgi:hypothetical protein